MKFKANQTQIIENGQLRQFNDSKYANSESDTLAYDNPAERGEPDPMQATDIVNMEILGNANQEAVGQSRGLKGHAAGPLYGQAPGSHLNVIKE